MELGNQQSRIKAARCYARAAFSFEREAGSRTGLKINTADFSC
jgi:hypothetical protein